MYEPDFDSVRLAADLSTPSASLPDHPGITYCAGLTARSYSARKDHRLSENSRGGEMPDRILTSHAGSLPRPENLIALNERRAEGDFTDEAEYWAGCARRWRTWSRASAKPASTSSTTANSATRWA